MSKYILLHMCGSKAYLAPGTTIISGETYTHTHTYSIAACFGAYTYSRLVIVAVLGYWLLLYPPIQ